jgi:hypothetical protein
MVASETYFSRTKNRPQRPNLDRGSAAKGVKIIVICIQIIVDLEGIEAIPTGLLSRRFSLLLPCFLGIAITIHFLFKSYQFRESACLFGAMAMA